MDTTVLTPQAAWGNWEPAGSTLRPEIARKPRGEPVGEEPVRAEASFESMVGQSAAFRQALKLVEKVAPTDSTVLLVGETGTGKELIARAIHGRSRRSDRAMIKLNCAAIPSGLLESELFGHERGAFTGANTRKMGRVELADQGTLFLDEVGDISSELQPKLLRVLQEREFERLGSTQTTQVDVRLVAATHRNLEGMIADKRFRSDLYYRLNVFPIEIPPLRARSGDIPLLVNYFLEHFARRMGKTIEAIPAETMDALRQHSWPGNIRELQNLMERAVILSSGPVLRVPLPHLRTPTTPAHEYGEGQTLAEAERKLILAALKDAEWVISGPKGAAARLGINRSSLQGRMRKLGIARPDEMWVET
jgi:formate hydrogenlyase transcriptional activator